MNILFILYGNFSTNTANPIVLFAQQLKSLGHECIIAVPSEKDTSINHDLSHFTPIEYDEVLQLEGKIFSNGKKADVLHACTPRIVIGNFLLKYLVRFPTPLVIYLEDNELWISKDYLGLSDEELLRLGDVELVSRLPEALSHPYEYLYLISLSDLVILIQEKLRIDVPEFMSHRVIPWGVNQEIFHPDIPPSEKWRQYFSINEDDKIIVYHGGLNGFTRPAILDLCKAIELINQQGISCKLIRTGINALNFWDELSPESKKYIFDAGVIPKHELPSVLALADLFVQPGRISPFEDLRLPSKVPEFLSMGRPVILPDVNISSLFIDGIDAILLKTGQPDEIAIECIKVLRSENYQKKLGANARIFAMKHFNLKSQTEKLVAAYSEAISNFNLGITQAVWSRCLRDGLLSAAILKLELISKQQPNFLNGSFKQLSNWIKISNQRLLSMGARVDGLEIQLNGFPLNSKKNPKKYKLLHQFIKGIAYLIKK